MNYKLTLSIIFIFFSINSFGQISNNELIRIKDSLNSEIVNSKKNRKKYIPMLESEVKQIDNLISKKDSLFPYQSYDSVVYTHYKQKCSPQLMDWSINNSDKKVKLNDAQIKQLLIFTYNPLNFGWWNCGYISREAKIEFYKNGNSIAEIQFTIQHRRLYCTPENNLIRYGCILRWDTFLDMIKTWN